MIKYQNVEVALFPNYSQQYILNNEGALKDELTTQQDFQSYDIYKQINSPPINKFHHRQNTTKLLLMHIMLYL